MASGGHRAWGVQRHLSAEGLIDYVAEFEISRAQVVAITEPMDGTFTLIYEPREGQNGHAEAVVTIAEAEAEEALEELFGTPITPQAAHSAHPLLQ